MSVTSCRWRPRSPAPSCRSAAAISSACPLLHDVGRLAWAPGSARGSALVRRSVPGSAVARWGSRWRRRPRARGWTSGSRDAAAAVGPARSPRMPDRRCRPAGADDGATRPRRSGSGRAADPRHRGGRPGCARPAPARGSGACCRSATSGATGGRPLEAASQAVRAAAKRSQRAWASVRQSCAWRARVERRGRRDGVTAVLGVEPIATVRPSSARAR